MLARLFLLFAGLLLPADFIQPIFMPQPVMLAFGPFNDGDRTEDPRWEAHAGHGILMKPGFSVLWHG